MLNTEQLKYLSWQQDKYYTLKMPMKEKIFY